MEVMMVFIGLFLFGAILSNKELTKNKANEDGLNFLTISSLFLILPGLGFLLPAAHSFYANYSFIIPIYYFMAAMLIIKNGKSYVFLTIAIIATFAFIIMGSY